MQKDNFAQESGRVSMRRAQAYRYGTTRALTDILSQLGLDPDRFTEPPRADALPQGSGTDVPICDTSPFGGLGTITNPQTDPQATGQATDYIPGLQKGSRIHQRFENMYQAVQQQPINYPRTERMLNHEFVQVTLPHDDPGSALLCPKWQRQTERLRLTIRPAYSSKGIIGYPYGTLPRLILIWLVTEIQKTKSHKLFLGETIQDFMLQIGISEKHTTEIPRLLDQMQRLFRCVFTLEYLQQEGTKQHIYWEDMQIVTKGLSTYDRANPSALPPYTDWIEVSPAFFQLAMQTPVCLDQRVLKAFQHSPLAIDLYLWFIHRLYYVAESARYQKVSWEQLAQATGADYRSPTAFAKKVKTILERLLIFYKGLNIEYSRGGFALSLR